MNKKVLVRVTFLLDATIPFQWGYEEIKNPGEKGNIGEVEAKTLYLVGGGGGFTHLYIYKNRN